MDGFRYQRRGLPQNGAEDTRTGNARTRRPRRSGNPDDFADEAAAQRPKRGARRAHGVGGKEDRRAESRTKNRCVRAESARAARMLGADDSAEGLRKLRELPPEELLRTVAVFRFLLPGAALRLAGGRGLLPDRGRAAFCSGANAALTEIGRAHV